MVLRKSFYIRWSAGRSPRVHEVNPSRDPSSNSWWLNDDIVNDSGDNHEVSKEEECVEGRESDDNFRRRHGG